MSRKLVSRVPRLLFHVHPSLILIYLSYLFLSPPTSYKDSSIVNIVADSIDKAYSLHTSANMFVFGEFNAN